MTLGTRTEPTKPHPPVHKILIISCLPYKPIFLWLAIPDPLHYLGSRLRIGFGKPDLDIPLLANLQFFRYEPNFFPVMTLAEDVGLPVSQGLYRIVAKHYVIDAFKSFKHFLSLCFWDDRSPELIDMGISCQTHHQIITHPFGFMKMPDMTYMKQIKASAS